MDKRKFERQTLFSHASSMSGASGHFYMQTFSSNQPCVSRYRTEELRAKLSLLLLFTKNKYRITVALFYVSFRNL